MILIHVLLTLHLPTSKSKVLAQVLPSALALPSASAWASPQHLLRVRIIPLRQLLQHRVRLVVAASVNQVNRIAVLLALDGHHSVKHIRFRRALLVRRHGCIPVAAILRFAPLQVGAKLIHRQERRDARAVLDKLLLEVLFQQRQCVHALIRVVEVLFRNVQEDFAVDFQRLLGWPVADVLEQLQAFFQCLPASSVMSSR